MGGSARFAVRCWRTRRRDTSGCEHWPWSRSSLRRIWCTTFWRRLVEWRAGDGRWQKGSVRGADAGTVGFVLHAFGGLCAAAAVRDVVRDDLLLVFAGSEHGGREAGGLGEGLAAAIGVA